MSNPAETRKGSKEEAKRKREGMKPKYKKIRLV